MAHLAEAAGDLSGVVTVGNRAEPAAIRCRGVGHAGVGAAPVAVCRGSRAHRPPGIRAPHAAVRRRGVAPLGTATEPDRARARVCDAVGVSVGATAVGRRRGAPLVGPARPTEQGVLHACGHQGAAVW